MTDYTALSNDELSRAVAERCGWEHQGEWECPKCGFVQVLRTLSAVDGSVGVNPDEGRRVCPNDGITLIPWVPPFPTSMDACLAPGGPVEWLEEHPDLKYMGLYRDGGAFRWEAEVFIGIREVMRHADTLSRAFCLAFLAATEPDGGGVA